MRSTMCAICLSCTCWEKHGMRSCTWNYGVRNAHEKIYGSECVNAKFHMWARWDVILMHERWLTGRCHYDHDYHEIHSHVYHILPLCMNHAKKNFPTWVLPYLFGLRDCTTVRGESLVDDSLMFYLWMWGDVAIEQLFPFTISITGRHVGVGFRSSLQKSGTSDWLERRCFSEIGRCWHSNFRIICFRFFICSWIPRRQTFYGHDQNCFE